VPPIITIAPAAPTPSISILVLIATPAAMAPSIFVLIVATPAATAPSLVVDIPEARAPSISVASTTVIALGSCGIDG
jgi:hypothetical protein